MNRCTAFLLLSACLSAVAQPKPAFEVVSIKPAPRPQPGSTSRFGFFLEGSRVEIIGFGLNGLIARAFRIENPQVDMHGFGDVESFEVQAKLPEGAMPAQIPEMIQSMLADRFKLTFHRETCEYPATLLTVGKDGMKLKRLPEGTPQTSSSDRRSDGSTRSTSIGTVSSLFPVMNSFGRFPQMVDETGLEGIYTWVLDTPASSPTLDFFEATHEAHQAMLEAAGLKLESRKVPKQTIVVDFAQNQPTEN